MSNAPRLFLPLLLSLILAAPVSAGVDEWTTDGPLGGGVSSVAVAPSDPDVLCAGTLSAGAFKSTDGGETWAVTGPGLRRRPVTWSSTLDRALTSFRDIAVDPVDPSRIYVANLGSGLFRSVDGGESWQRVGAEVVLPRICDFNLGANRTLHAATEGCVFESLDPCNGVPVRAADRLRIDDGTATVLDVPPTIAAAGDGTHAVAWAERTPEGRRFVVHTFDTFGHFMTPLPAKTPRNHGSRPGV